MIKRITKITGLLVSVASVISIMPVQAADIQKLDAQSGTIESTKAKGNGIFIDGEINGADEAVYWMSDDGKYNTLDVETGSTMTDELMNKYLEIDTSASDLTYVDITNGYKVVDYDVREDLEATVARTIKGKLRHDDNGRFVKDTLDNGDFTTLYNRESSISPTGGKEQVGAVSTSDGLSVFQVPLKDDLDDGISNSVKYNKGSLETSTATSVSNTSAVYADATGNYVDADYNLGSLKIYADSTTGASVTIKNTDDSYDITKDGKTYELKAVLQENKYITEVSDTVSRLANLTIYKKEKNSNDPYTEVTDADGFKFGGKLTVNGTTTVVQAFSKTPASDTVNGIKYSKDSTIYFISDEDGNPDVLIGNSATDAVNKTGAATGGSTKITGNDKNLCSIYLDNTNKEIYAETLTLKHKNSFNYVDIGDYDSSDIDSVDNGGIATAGGAPWFVNSGYIMTWDGDNSFIKTNKIDSGISGISIGSKTKMIVWDYDKEVYSIINIAKAAASTATKADAGTASTATTTGAAVTIGTTTKAGWVSNKDNTWSYILENGTKKTGWLNSNGAWYYLKADGVMTTSWVNDNGTWYYLNKSGAMKTGWINDNETWYYCNESGAMLSNTTVDGYVLGTDGAWIK
jgi:hypothetical protein